MNRKYFAVILAVSFACLILIIVTVVRSSNTAVPNNAPELPSIHSIAPFKSYISAIGIVEPSSTNISIGVPVNRLVQKMLVSVGTKVQAGTPLFILENRDLKAELYAQQTAYKSAQVKLAKLEALPRQEDLSAAEAALKIAALELEQAKSENERVKGLQNNRAMSLEEIQKRHFAFEQAQAKWLQAQADFEKIREGTWAFDLDIARLNTLQAKANRDRARTEVERTTIRSPIEGSVLQINIHEGEMPPMDTLRSPIMVVGNIDDLYIRVSINQFDLPFYKSTAAAAAYLQGYASRRYDLELVRIEPLLIDKENVNNSVMEKVDTYVLPVIYRIKKGDHENLNLYVGQKMDVYIQTTYTSENGRK